MANPSVASTGSRSAIASIVALTAIIGAIYTMQKPMIQRMDFLEDEITQLRADVASKDQFAGLTALVDVRLTPLENARDRRQERQATHDLRVRGTNSAQWERIKALERVVYGKALPVSVGEAPGAGMQ